MTFNNPAVQVSFYSAGFGALGPKTIKAYNEFGSVLEEKVDVDSLIVTCATGEQSVDESGMVLIKFGPYASGELIKKIEFVSPGVMDSLKISYIDKSVCNVRDKGRVIEHFSQKNEKWAMEPYDHTTKSISALGCALTSLAMLLKSYGINKDTNGDLLTPPTLNEDLKNLRDQKNNTAGYTTEGNIIWGGAVSIAKNSFIKECETAGGATSDCVSLSKKKVSFVGKYLLKDFDEKAIESEVCSGNPVMLEVPGYTSSSHFVLAVGTVFKNDKKTFLIQDPLSNDTKDTVLTDNYSQIKGVRLFRSENVQQKAIRSLASDSESMMFIYATMNVELLVTDPEGRRTGFDPISKEILNEIPGTSYTTEDGIADADLSDGVDDSTKPSRLFQSMSPLNGSYNVSAYSANGGPYQITAYSFDTDANLNAVDIKEGAAVVDSVQTATFDHTDIPVPSLNADIKIKNIFINAKPKKEEEKILISGKIKPRDALLKTIKLEDNFRLRIGNFSLLIPAKEFKVKGNRKLITYTYKSKDRQRIKVTFRSDGQFIVKAKHVDIVSLDSTTLILEMGIDKLNAAKEITWKCNRSKCRGKCGK